ncbi:MAG: hypothetical protein FJW95_03965, partial [Actinobacteria bacterium]|nr:hypothetical protein [Actinomycetota bacterium]
MRINWDAMGQGYDPRDQQARLFGPYWATVGPEGDAVHGQWAWAVFDTSRGSDPVAVGFGVSEADAKDAVVDWARPRAPRTLRRRLRALRR